MSQYKNRAGELVERYQTSEIHGFIVCKECGGVVWSTAAHDGFHERLQKTAYQANYADSMTRPIGGY